MGIASFSPQLLEGHLFLDALALLFGGKAPGKRAVTAAEENDQDYREAQPRQQ